MFLSTILLLNVATVLDIYRSPTATNEFTFVAWPKSWSGIKKKKKGYNYNRDKENFFPFLDDRVPFISSLAGLSFRSISPSPSPIFLFLSSTHFSDDDYCSITRRATSKKVLVKFLRPPSFPEDISPPPNIADDILSALSRGHGGIIPFTNG